MKRCSRCNDFSLYDDEIMNCPVCGQVLTTYVRRVIQTQYVSGNPVSGSSVSNNTAASNVGRAPLNTSVQTGTHRSFTPEFETRRGFSYVYRGIVTEVTPQARLHSSLKKWVNAVFKGEPYQLSNTLHSTTFRVMDVSNGSFSRRKRDFIFYGDVEGRFFVGDDVEVTAKRRGNKYIVTRMHLNDTETDVRPSSIQIPAIVLRLFALVIAYLLVSFISGVVFIVASGAFQQIMNELLSLFICVALVAGIVRSLRRR